MLAVDEGTSPMLRDGLIRLSQVRENSVRVISIESAIQTPFTNHNVLNELNEELKQNEGSVVSFGLRLSRVD